MKGVKIGAKKEKINHTTAEYSKVSIKKYTIRKRIFFLF